MRRITTVAAVCGAIAVLAAGGATAGAACVTSTPTTQSYSDAAGDAQLGLAPDITAGTVSIDGACGMTLSYSMIDPDGMVFGDFVGWFLDADGNAATGSTAGFTGADYAVGRLADGFTGLSRFNSSTGLFQAVKQVSPSGMYGALLSINDVAAVPGATMTVAGASTWKSSSTGNSYYDFAPDVGQPPVGFGVVFSEAAPAPPPPPPVPAPAPPAPAAPPIPAPKPAACRVPLLKGLTVARARGRLRRAHCILGQIRYVRGHRHVGRVIRASRSRGAKLSAGAKVNVTVVRWDGHARGRAAVATADTVAGLINQVAAAR